MKPLSIFLADKHEPPPQMLAWSAKFEWPLSKEIFGPLQLEWKDGILSLCHREKKLPRVNVDLIELWRDTRINQNDPFAKAIGVRRGLRRVVDATAGLGADLIKLLKLGCEVVAIERSPVLFALLEDAWRRAAQDERWLKGGGRRARLVFGEAEEILPTLPAEEREVVFLDPMYPPKRKSALSKGRMQVLQDLLGEGAEQDQAEKLWAIGMAYATKRVVLKRPKNYPGHPAIQPEHCYQGKSTTYFGSSSTISAGALARSTKEK